jgi:hypothetical protein
LRRPRGGLLEHKKGGKQGRPSPGQGKRTMGGGDVDKMQYGWRRGTSEGAGVVGQRETQIEAPMATRRKARSRHGVARARCAAWHGRWQRVGEWHTMRFNPRAPPWCGAATGQGVVDGGPLEQQGDGCRLQLLRSASIE